MHTDSRAEPKATPRSLALWALALGVFGVGTTEFVPVGLLPQVADDFGVSIPAAGWLVSAYAIGVLIGAPLMTMLGVRVPRKRMLLGLMLIFTVGNVVSAAAPTFGLMLTGRVITSFTHGAFFGVGIVVAAQLADPNRRAGAVAFVLSGLALANLVGVPLGTWLGDKAGWRATFVAIAILGALTLTLIALLVPALPRPEGVDLRSEVRALANVQVVLAMLASMLGFGGVFAALTYLAPMMTDVAGFPTSAMTWILIILGIGMVFGNWLGGKMADRSLMPTVVAGLTGLLLALLAFVFTVHSQPLAIVTIFLLGTLGFSVIPPLQTLVLDRAATAPTLSSAMNNGAFNFGNAIAAWSAGAAIDAGLGYPAASWVGAILTGLGLAVAIASIALSRQRTRPAPVATHQDAMALGSAARSSDSFGHADWGR